MEFYLIGENLWDVVSGAYITKREEREDNAEDLKWWIMTNGKAKFVLKRSISHGLFDHIIKCKAANDIWETLNRLFDKKDIGRLQMLKNELANTTQGDLSISQLFIKIKNLCSEISLLDLDEPVFEARIQRHIVHGLKKEYTLFVTSIQGWDQQPFL